MKKIILVFAVLLFTLNCWSQTVSKTIHIDVPGSLSTNLTANEKATITDLTVTGSIDARDFKTMRDNMPLLANLDMTNVTIVAYTGNGGTTAGTNSVAYAANKIPDFSFYTIKNNTSLNSAILPLSITDIGKYAFCSCGGLTKINIPASVKVIGDCTFYNCISLISLSIPESVKSLGSNVFYNCKNIKSIYVAGGNLNYSSIEGVLFDKNQTCLIQYPIGKTDSTYSIPQKVNKINGSAFLNCLNLVSVTIPASVMTIGDYAFSNCKNISSINMNSKPVNISYSTFTNSNQSTCILNVPYLTKKLYESDTYWKYFVNIAEPVFGFLLDVYDLNVAGNEGSVSVDISANIPWTANSDQSWLTVNPSSGTGNNKLILTVQNNQLITSRVANVTVSSPGFASQTITINQDGVFTVSAGALKNVLAPYGLSSIKNLTLKGSIDARDFQIMRDSMPVLTSVDLSKTNIVAYFGNDATIPYYNTQYPVNEIPANALRTGVNKTSLIKFIMPLSTKTIGEYAFYCTGLRSITIPNEVTTIGNDAFYICSNLRDVYISNSVTSIGVNAFLGCSNLDTINIPNSVISIGDNAFNSCSNLSVFNLPASLTSIGLGVFDYCNNLEEINVETLNQNFSSVNGILFNKDKTTLIKYPCKRNGSIYTIPASISSINYSAFLLCSGLTSISIPLSVDSIGSFAFYECTNLTSIYVNRPVPVDLSSSNSVFYNVNKANCTLYVPTGSKALYQAAVQWKDFTNIVEMATALPVLSGTASIQVYPNPVIDNLHISGIDAGARIMIFDLNGRVVLEAKLNNSNTISLGMLPRGQYVLRAISSEKVENIKIIKL